MIRPAHRRHHIQTEGRRFRVTSAGGSRFLVYAQDEKDAREEGLYRLLIAYNAGDHRIVHVEELIPEPTPV